MKNYNEKISVKFINRLTIGLSCLMITTGCASHMAQHSGVEQKTRNEVEMVRIPFNLQFNDGQSELSGREIARLNNFLNTANIGYGDELSMDFPLDRNGDLSQIDQQRFKNISDLLKNSGLHLAGTITPYGMEPSANSGRLLVSKYVVTPPECGDWSQNPYPNHQNAPISNFGCANQANLGLMVANPKDLVTGATGAPTNAERTARAVEKYQSKNVTVAPASTGSASN